MNKQLMEVVLPAWHALYISSSSAYRAGQMDDAQFTKGFEALLRKQHAWLARRGVPEARAALAIHGAVLILSGPGLRAEAAEAHVPLELVEYRAVREAASDVAANYGLSEPDAIRVISGIVARYGD